MGFLSPEPLRLHLAALFGAGLACSISLANISWVAAGFAWLATLMACRPCRAWKPTGLEFPAAAFAVWSLAVSDWSLPALQTFRNYEPQTLLLVFFIVTQYFDGPSSRRLLRVFLAVSVVCALWGILQSLGGMNWDPTTGRRQIPARWDFLEEAPFRLFRYLSLRNGRAEGPRSHPLTYAECLLPAFLILLHLSLSRRAQPAPWRTRAAVGMIGLAMILSQSRGVWLGMAAGIGCLALLVRDRGARLTLAGAGALALLFLFALPSTRPRFMSIFRDSAGIDQTSKMQRFRLWGMAAGAIRAHPVTGVGTGRLRLLMPEGGPSPGKLVPWSEAHNAFLQQAAEKGLVGLGLFLWLLFSMGRVFSRAGPLFREGFLSAYVGLLGCGLTESLFTDSTVTMLLYALCGVAWHLGREPAQIPAR